MSGLRRLILFALISIGAIMFRPMWMDSIRPRVPPEVAAGHVKPDEQLARKLQLFEAYKTLSTVVTIVVILGTAWILIPRPQRRDPDKWPYVTLLVFASSGYL